MPRVLSSGMLTALSAAILYPAIFVQATFATSTVYLWSGVGSITWNSHSWTGLGSLLGITTPEDSSNVEAKGITVTLSGFDATLLPDAMSEFQLGLPVNVYLGLFTDSTLSTLVSSPVTSWAGRMDQPTIEVSGTEGLININCESRLIDMNISVDRRYTNEDQQMTWPGDLCFSFVDGIQQKTIYWGGYPMSQNNL